MPSVQCTSTGNQVGIRLPTGVGGTSHLTVMGWIRLADATEPDNGGSSGGLGMGVSSSITVNATPSLSAWPGGPESNRRVAAVRRGDNLFTTSFLAPYAVNQWVYVVIYVPTTGTMSVRMFADDSGLTLLGTLTRATNTNVGRILNAFRPNAGVLRVTAFKAFDGGAFTDPECRAQAVTRAAVSHSTATLRDRWELVDHTALTGLVDGLVFGTIAQSGNTYETNSDEPSALTPPPSGPSPAAIHDYLTLNGLTPGV